MNSKLLFTAIPCPESYSYQFGASCYKLLTEAGTMDTARGLCQAEGGDLVAVESMDEYAYLETFATTQLETGELYFHDLYT